MDALKRLASAGMLAPVVAAALLAASCGGSSGGTASTASPAPLSAAVGISDVPGGGNATSVGVAVRSGGRVSITVAENPTTGYQWTLMLPRGVTQVSSAYSGPSPAPSPLMGAGGTRTYVVKVGQPGVYTVRGEYARPWESRMPAKTFEVRIFAPPASRPGVTDYFTEKDSPGAFVTDVGRTFAIVLEENPSTGYSWTMKLGPGLELLTDDFVAPSPSPSPLAGAGGQRIWVIAVKQAGTTALTGIYARPSDAASKNAATFSLSVKAAPLGQ